MGADFFMVVRRLIVRVLIVTALRWWQFLLCGLSLDPKA